MNRAIIENDVVDTSSGISVIRKISRALEKQTKGPLQFSMLVRNHRIPPTVQSISLSTTYC